jgi:hypothetical protein
MLSISAADFHGAIKTSHHHVKPASADNSLFALRERVQTALDQQLARVRVGNRPDNLAIQGSTEWLDELAAELRGQGFLVRRSLLRRYKHRQAHIDAGYDAEALIVTLSNARAADEQLVE